MAASVTTLAPVWELAPGQMAAIRNAVIDAVVEKASSELALRQEQLVVRDIRPYNDLGMWAVTTVLDTAAAADTWGSFCHAASMVNAPASGGAYVASCTSGKTIADDRYVAVWGVRDNRGGVDTVTANAITLIKWVIGNATRAIWDLTKAQLHYSQAVAVSPSAIVMPPLAPVDIQLYLHADNVEPYLQLIGCVVEPVGKVVTP